MTSPATSTSSLIATGTPSSGSDSPAVEALGRAIGLGARLLGEHDPVGVELSGFRRSIRSRYASTTSRGETSPAAIIAACCAAPAKARSVASMAAHTT